MSGPSDATGLTGRRLAVNLAIGAVGSYGAARGGYQLLAQQARLAREVIPKPTDIPPNGDGLYRADTHEVQPWRHGSHADTHIMIFGDSLATGLGVDKADEVPGVLIARGVAEESRKDVRLSTKALVGATSKGLEGQVDAMLIAGPPPDVAVILIGGNDITARNSIAGSAKRLGLCVERLREHGSHVVVGTCPDLGTIQPVPQPLRSVLHSWSLRLAAAQANQVRRYGGVSVSLADTLAPEFNGNPEVLFSADQFHPSAAGYELAAGLLLPAVFTGLGLWEAPPKVESTDSVDTAAAEQITPDRIDHANDSDAKYPPRATDTGESSPVDTDAEESAKPLAVPRMQVVAQLISRLSDFSRRRENLPQTGKHLGRHNGLEESAASADRARLAAEILRRNSRAWRNALHADNTQER